MDTSGHQKPNDTKDTEYSPVIVIEPSSDDDGHEDFTFKDEDSPPIFEEFKAPEKPKKGRRVTRRKVTSPKKESLKCYDAEYSDGTDA